MSVEVMETKSTPQRASPGDKLRRVLLIQLGPLREFAHTLYACSIVRQTHRSAHITLLTTSPFEKFAKACPYFNAVEVYNEKTVADLQKKLKKAKYNMVYDFNNTNDSEKLAKSTGSKFLSADTKEASHPFNSKVIQHFQDRSLHQLYMAGIGENGVKDPLPWPSGASSRADLSWIRAAFRNPPHLEPAYFNLYERYALIAPGVSGLLPERRWPPARFADICKRIKSAGITPVLIGAAEDGALGQEISKLCPEVRNIITRTDLFQLVTLSEKAVFFLGGENGATYVSAMTNRPGVFLIEQNWSKEMEAEYDTVFDPRLHVGAFAPKGGNIVVNSAPHLTDLSADDVWRSILALGVL